YQVKDRASCGASKKKHPAGCFFCSLVAEIFFLFFYFRCKILKPTKNYISNSKNNHHQPKNLKT
ncbi:hypothetical protein, partial [Turicibacter sanguinis]|uniref:hypothetical protein n=1 Tax=Turicibacter sanguinis TaxID=154288 RepID=UPI001E3BB009